MTKTTRPAADFAGLWVMERSGGDRVEAEYVNGVQEGVYRYVKANGVCIREGRKKGGRWHGRHIIRAADGTVLSDSEFIDGNGIYRIFNTAKQLTDEVPLFDGRPHGTAKRWVRGVLVELRHYENGMCVAVSTP